VVAGTGPRGHFPVIDDNDSSTEKRWFDATKRSLRHPSSDDQLMNRSRGVQVSAGEANPTNATHSSFASVAT
jgi:hypothetical protein